MKKRTTRLCSALLSLLILTLATTALQASATETINGNTPSTETRATGDLSLQVEDTYDGVIIGSAEDYYKLNKSTAVNGKGNLIKASSTLPDSIDNSRSKYFPLIGNQGSLGSCVAWAQVYYQFTYTMNKEMGVATTTQNTFSPTFIYNLISGGDADSGGVYSDVNFIMNEVGNVPASVVPISDNVTNWYATENIRREALRYRIKDYQKFDDLGEDEKSQITSADDKDLEAVKTSLSNGDVLTFSTEINSWVTSTLKKNSNAPENDNFYGEDVVTAQIGSNGGHRMTIVGYNDNIWTDINNNNTVDSGEMGALKIANSWGEGYANEGFIWVAYDALNKTSCVDGGSTASGRMNPIRTITRIEVMPYNSTNFYLKYTLNTSDRDTVKPYLIAEKDGTEYSTNTFANTTFSFSEANKISFDGTTNATDGTFLYPLDIVVESVTSESFSDYTWSVKYIDTEDDGKVLTVKDAQIVDESTNTVYTPAAGTYPIELENDEVTIELAETSVNHAVVYYRGYEAAQLTYKVGNGTWTTVAMEENIERDGYVHKFVIDLGSNSQTTFYFSDNNGNVDNNSEKYYTAGKGVSYFVTENARQPLATKIAIRDGKGVKDVNTAIGFIAQSSGGYEPYSYQFISEDLVSGAVSTRVYSESNTFGYFPRSEGNHRVTVNVMDYSGEIATDTYEFYVEDVPFAFESFEITTSNNILVGQEVGFSATTVNEALRYIGHIANEYDVTIEKNGVVCYSETMSCDEYNMSYRYTTTDFIWTPTEAGSYTAKISSKDSSGEYAEATISFDVAEYNGTIIGDVDNDGYIKIMDATLIQKYCVEQLGDSDVWTALADCDKDDSINIKDATYIQLYLAAGESDVYVGTVNYKEPEPTTEPTTVPPTTVQPTTAAEKNLVTFTDSLNWGGTIRCYYWSDSNTSMTTWPGKAMTYLQTNDYGQKQYTFEVPDGATYIIFTNGSSQTVDIKYGGGEIRYYALSTTGSNGHYNVATW